MTASISPVAASYALDSTWHAERRRLQSLTGLYDPASVSISERLGVRPGWRCADVGAGTGSLAQELAARVAPGGSVLAGAGGTRRPGPRGAERPHHDAAAGAGRVRSRARPPPAQRMRAGGPPHDGPWRVLGPAAGRSRGLGCDAPNGACAAVSGVAVEPVTSHVAAVGVGWLASRPSIRAGGRMRSAVLLSILVAGALSASAAPAFATNP